MLNGSGVDWVFWKHLALNQGREAHRHQRGHEVWGGCVGTRTAREAAFLLRIADSARTEAIHPCWRRRTRRLPQPPTDHIKKLCSRQQDRHLPSCPRLGVQSSSSASSIYRGEAEQWMNIIHVCRHIRIDKKINPSLVLRRITRSGTCTHLTVRRM